MKVFFRVLGVSTILYCAYCIYADPDALVVKFEGTIYIYLIEFLDLLKEGNDYAATEGIKRFIDN